MDYFQTLDTQSSNTLRPHVGVFQKDYPKDVIDFYKNHSNTHLITAHPDYESDAIIKLKQDLDIEDLYCRYQIQHPGNIVLEHVDTNRPFSTKLVETGIDKQVKVKNIKKYLVFLEDWAHGQVIMTGRHAYTDWRKGDVISFPWFMPHSTANAGLKPRPILFITGLKY